MPGDEIGYPPAPWTMHGSMWLTVFRVGAAPDRPRGIYGVAFVRYDEPSPLTYHELLVARVVREPVRALSITDIWVDSPASMAGGRELWAIPKQLCAFTEDSTQGRLHHTRLTATGAGRRLCSATFADTSRHAPRVPFRGRTWQPALQTGPGAGGGARVADLRGRGRALPARAHWDFATDGPLGWLTGARQLGSVRMSDFEMRFG